VLAPDGSTRPIPLTPSKPLFEHLTVRSPTDVWAVTSDTEWALMHHDGKRWTEVRRRDQFPGKFDDNKFTAFAVTNDAVWVSSWNGLWRGTGRDWQRVELPDKVGSPELFVFKGQLIAGT